MNLKMIIIYYIRMPVEIRMNLYTYEPLNFYIIRSHPCNRKTWTLSLWVWKTTRFICIIISPSLAIAMKNVSKK